MNTVSQELELGFCLKHKVGPLPVITGVITPINGLING